MANTIITPGEETNIENNPIPESNPYLERDNYLSEYNDEEKDIVRSNLQVPFIESVYTITDANKKINETVNKAINNHLAMEDPHEIIPFVEGMIEGMVKNDGSTPFILALEGIDGYSENDLTTQKFVKNLLKKHISSEDPHEILIQVKDILEKYAKSNDVYTKKLTEDYTKSEINKQISGYVKKDGTIPFTKPLSGIDPKIDSHLVTKRYADKILANHLIDVDPHGFILILNNRLSSYIKRSEVWDRTQTYSRSQIDSNILKMVNQAINSSVLEYIDSTNDKFETIRKLRYIKLDGSIPFHNPQTGVDAVNSLDLVTLHQVDEKVDLLKLDIPYITKWITSGPAETTVGFVEDNSSLPETMTFQEIMDAIFYGKQISLIVPEYITIGLTGEITICVHGTTGLIQSAVLYLDDEPIYSFNKKDFEEGCITVNSNTITKDTVFTFEVTYSNDTTLEESKTVLCSYPIFVGLLPKWKFGNVVTMEYLEELTKEDPINNKFINGIPSLIVLKYNFKDAKLKHLLVALPAEYPDLETMITKSLSFDVDSFDVIDLIPLQLLEKDVTYKIYIYRQALSSLNQEVTFNFKPKEE